MSESEAAVVLPPGERGLAFKGQLVGFDPPTGEPRKVGLLFTPEELQVLADALRWAEREWSLTQTQLQLDPAHKGAVGLQDLFDLKRGIARELYTKVRTKGRAVGVEFA